MFSLVCVHKMSKWLVIFLILFSSFASSFLPVKANENLFLRNLPQRASAVEGSATQSAIRNYRVSQMQEIGIGVGKAATESKQSEGESNPEWGKAKQVDTYTWTIQVGQDSRNATAKEILAALNLYRQKHGRGTLHWDDKLASYAQERAVSFSKKNTLDAHAGFSDYVSNQDGFHKLGFAKLGENSSFGYTLEGVHLIEWVYAGDKPHNDNQLSSTWTHVGIGVDGTATNLIFAADSL
jgi:uncharacterized protein YkwD